MPLASRLRAPFTLDVLKWMHGAQQSMSCVCRLEMTTRVTALFFFNFVHVKPVAHLRVG